MSSSTTGAENERVDNTGWSADLYNQKASFVYSSAYTSPVLDLLSPKPGERIIDFGCGSGEVTLKIREQTGIAVVGVDASQSMIQKALANGVETAFVSDVQDLQFPAHCGFAEDKFDAVFTNATLHWCKRDPRGVIRSAKKVLKKGGRFVGEMGGWMNCTGVRSALYHVLNQRGYDPANLDPWFFPSVDDYTELLRSESMKPLHVSLTPRLTPLPEGLAGWLQVFVRNAFLKTFSDEEAEAIIKEVEDLCRIDCQDSSGRWAMMYTRLRFAAVTE